MKTHDLLGGGNHDHLNSHLNVVGHDTGWVTITISGPRRGQPQSIQVRADDLIRALRYVTS